MNSLRRKDREIPLQDAIKIIDDAEYGVLSTVDKGGHPYGVPLSFVFNNYAIYFHCAVTGLKLENIANNSKASFCVVGSTNVLPDKFGTEYESAIAFGNVSEIQGSEKNDALVWLLEKYCAEFLHEGLQYIESKDKATKVFKMEISHISGKARK